ncbi:hypothetical protein B0H13DRAFT_1887220 [Mycena leptocephala]|nr:hypothetical protein B0H13DRAFT_1887220 [Mycena leptocephala]
MPVPIDSPHTTWLEYLNGKVPECPHTLPGSDPKLIEQTHDAGKSSLAACGGKTQFTSSSQILSGVAGLDEVLKKAPAIVAEEPYTQPLHNEQAVAEVFFKNILTPVGEALHTFLKQMFKGDLEEVGYFFNIRPQQCSPTGDRTRSDHYLVLEHMEGIAAREAPHKQMIWETPDEFKKMLAARRTWNKSNLVGPPPKYPRLVLCVIEEEVGLIPAVRAYELTLDGYHQQPHVIDPEEFTNGYVKRAQAKDGTGTAAANVKKFLPQLKKYSIDAQCNLVILTDYTQILLLDVKEPGASFNSEKNKINNNGKPAKVAVYRLTQPPRYVLFCTAIKRLMDAGCIKRWHHIVAPTAGNANLWPSIDRTGSGLDFCRARDPGMGPGLSSLCQVTGVNPYLKKNDCTWMRDLVISFRLAATRYLRPQKDVYDV